MLSIENIYLAAIVQGVFQVVALVFIRRGNRRANRMLAFLVGLLIMTLWNMYTYSMGLPAYWRVIDYGGWYSIFFWGPTLYLYVGIISGLIHLNATLILRHFSFGVVLWAIGTTVHFLKSADWLAPSFAETIDNLRMLAFYIQMSLYFLASFQLLKTYNSKIRNSFSSIDEMNLSWLQRLVAVFAVMITVDMCVTVPSVLSSADDIPYFEVYLLAEAAAVFAIGYFSLLHSESLFRNIKPKYESSPLDNKMSSDLSEKLKAIMEESAPYKNNDLKLDDLAKLVGISPYYLSQIINEQCRKNFYDFVNEYRAKSAAELLLQDRGINITQIAYMAGFNNRTSFNNAFKKYTGMTPSQYRRKS